MGGVTSLNSAMDPGPDHTFLVDIKICKILLGFRMRLDPETPAPKQKVGSGSASTSCRSIKLNLSPVTALHYPLSLLTEVHKFNDDVVAVYSPP
jgi:hypothetical protein